MTDHTDANFSSPARRSSWIASIVTDRPSSRAWCIVNIVRHHGPVEQRFKIKYFGEDPIALEDIDSKDWKTRTITRGDRFLFDQHYCRPVIDTPVLIIIVA